MVTPQLQQAAAMVPSTDVNDDILTIGVDGSPTRMRASKCEVISLGSSGNTCAHLQTTVFAGTCPMMRLVGWEGTSAALLGLDVLRLGARGGQPLPAASGGPKVGRLILDFERSELLLGE
jgi:hypothetical protein